MRSGPNLFGSDVDGIKELGSSGWKEIIEGDTSRRSVVVLFYQPGCRECDDLKEAFRELGSKFVASGIVAAGAVNCGKQEAICKKQSVNSLPAVFYFGPEGKPKKHPPGQISYKSLSHWLPHDMADYCQVIRRDADLRKWLGSDDAVPHVLLFSDKKTVPPILKGFSVEFKGRAALGAILADADPNLLGLFKIEKRPALVHIVDEVTLSVDHFEKEFKKETLNLFLSRAVGKHRSGGDAMLRELTSSRLAAGDCAPSASYFCLLFFSTPGQAGESTREALRVLAQRLRRDPVKVFIVRDRSFAKPFNAKAGEVLLYRPKRKRWKVFDGDASNIDELAAFVDVAVGGGAQLPQLLSSVPTFRNEL